MTSQSMVWRFAALALVVVSGSVACSGCATAKAESQMPEDQQVRFDALKEAGAGASIVVFPVMSGDRVRRDAGDVVGLMLEQGGMTNLETTESEFKFSSTGIFEDLPVQFGKFVKENPISGDYALYAEFIGSPDTGVKEVRGVIVDKAGQCVWLTRQKEGDRMFKKAKPKCPMTCCHLLTECLMSDIGLKANAAGPGKDGKFARIWEDRSGTPKEKEAAALDQRQAEFRKKIASSGLVLYPILVGKSVDADAARNLSGEIAGLYSKAVSVSESSPYFEIKPNSNEQRRLWDLAREFRDYIRNNPPTQEYALYAEYTLSKQHRKVYAVHFIVCDRDGEWVIVDYQNSHHADFNSVNPETCDDCNKLVAKRLARYAK